MLMVFLMYAVSMIKEPGGNHDNFLLSFWVLKSRLLPLLWQNYPFGTHLFELRKYSRGAASFSLLTREAAKHLVKRKTHDVNFKIKTHKTQAIREMSLFTTTDVQFVKQTESGKCLNSSNKKTLSLHSDSTFYGIRKKQASWLLRIE